LSASLDTRYVANLLGTGILRVNKLVPLCHMGARTKSAKMTGRGMNRRYEVEEICEVALAYWLFRAGLRGPFIASILADGGVDRFIAPMTSFKRIRAEGARHRFLIAWGFKTTRKAKKWKVEHEGVVFVGNLGTTLRVVGNHVCVIVPVGRLLGQLADMVMD
jgi:hypothetical protein